MSISELKAAEVLYAAHAAWNKRDIPALLDLFDDDMTYWSNVGSLDYETIFRGKVAFASFLSPLQTMEGLSVPHCFRFKDGIASASIEFYLRDQKTGHSHSGTFRQALEFSADRMLLMAEYHDAAGLSSFIALVSSESSAS